MLMVGLLSCAGTRPGNLGVSEGKLADCPPSPNCVCSDAPRGSHFIEPLRLEGDPEQAWQAARRAVDAMPRTRIVRSEAGYLHAECRSAILGFVDDLELQLDAAGGVIGVRSASRLGWSDMGVNRRRVESLRAELAQAGVIR